MLWFRQFRGGDWLVILLGLLFCLASLTLVWNGGIAERVQIRRGGELVGEYELSRNRQIEVNGPLGTTTIAIHKNRVRVVSDPGFHQYCVRQGWLERTGEIAICAPNQVSIQVKGRREAYDSLSY